MDTCIDQAKIGAATNPYLEAIASHLSTDDIEHRLPYSPLTGVDVRQLSTQARFDMLDRMQLQMFQPTLTSLDTTTRLFRMIRRGYLLRDPSLSSNRTRTINIARFAGKNIEDLPWLPPTAHGMRNTGITGLGKTYELTRALELIPPCILHGRSDAADWTHMTQVPWLYVGMSHDGSLGGLLLQILVALDKAAGTDYSNRRSITRLSNEKLAVQVGIALSNHAVGVLVIDEIQERNFSGGVRGGLAATFFLRMLNFGIPIVLMGNPLGMKVLDTFSQDMRRIGSGGSIEMHPMQVADDDFVKFFAPAIWRYNVMDEASPIQDADGTILYKYSGGIRDYACRIVTAAQRLALDLGHKCITQEHLDQAFEGPDFSRKDRDLIAGFRDKNPFLLQQFDDIPWQQYAIDWGKFTPAEASIPSPSNTTQSNDATSSIPSKRTKPVSQQDHENMTRNRTRKENAKRKNAEAKANLSHDDMRNSGLQEHLISQFEHVRQNQPGTEIPQ
ncbi:MAG: ATP-binding protein [Pseudomonadota bacterium]